MTKPIYSGLYVITDAQLIGGKALLPSVEAAIEGGANWVQYRDKNQDSPRRRKEAGALLSLCQQAQVPLLINDDVVLAQEIGADGVHLGQSDMDIATARKKLGAEAIIGLTCHNNINTPGLELADYAAFGRFFPSSSKPDAPAASLDILRSAKAHLQMPIAAIGGIDAHNAPALIEAGADMLAVIAGVFSATDIRKAAAELNKLFH